MFTVDKFEIRFDRYPDEFSDNFFSVYDKIIQENDIDEEPIKPGFNDWIPNFILKSTKKDS